MILFFKVKMEAFFQPSSETSAVPVTTQKTKKRKVSEEKKEDNEEMKQKAKLYCKCTE